MRQSNFSTWAEPQLRKGFMRKFSIELFFQNTLTVFMVVNFVYYCTKYLTIRTVWLFNQCWLRYQRLQHFYEIFLILNFRGGFCKKYYMTYVSKVDDTSITLVSVDETETSLVSFFRDWNRESPACLNRDDNEIMLHETLNKICNLYLCLNQSTLKILSQVSFYFTFIMTWRSNPIKNDKRCFPAPKQFLGCQHRQPEEYYAGFF